MQPDPDRLALAERYLDEMLAAEAAVDHAAFCAHFDPPDVERFGPTQFKKDMFAIREDFGDYVSRDFLGALKGRINPDRPDRHPNSTRYVWRGVFEKNETLIVVGLFDTDDGVKVNEFTYR